VSKLSSDFLRHNSLGQFLAAIGTDSNQTCVQILICSSRNSYGFSCAGACVFLGCPLSVRLFETICLGVYKSLY